ncbi:MAG: aspartate--ammonia ligase [Oscillospiraceae bacterium]
MNTVYVPHDYKSVLSLYETQTAIGIINRTFEDFLALRLRLKRVSAPLFVDPQTGLNDNLSGVERPVRFEIPATGSDAEVVHSLAKWKRMALYRYDFHAGKGIYANMNAIRRDEELDNLHSIYVDQWDWEKVITRADRTEEYLKQTVRSIVSCVCDTLDVIKDRYESVGIELCREVSFVSSQELEDMYPKMTSKERENAYLAEKKTAFIMCIGEKLKSGKPHDSRSPDYDDWSLNGDLMFYDELLGCAMELSSMGIRVDSKSLGEQLTKACCDDRRKLLYHKMLLKDELPLTIGGGIGQSRLCMLLLEKAHIGEVQSSIWDEQSMKTCKEANIILL